VEEDVRIAVPEGPVLHGRLEGAEAQKGGLVVCHPHPLYGGDMDNPVVVRAADAARQAGLMTLRFDFRGVGRSTGTHGGGKGEREDARAALALVRSRVPPGKPVGVAGYSFGAWVAAQATGQSLPLGGLCLIAPPLAMLDFQTLDAVTLDALLVAGTRDPYCPTRELAALAERLPGARTVSIEGADHFFSGELAALGEAIRSWAGRWALG
jgi:uncharacterized protein